MVKALQWSKTKSILESFLCDKLKGRIQIYATIYRKFHDGPSRVWITFDKKEILSASDTKYQIVQEKLYQQIRDERRLKGIPYSPVPGVMFNSAEREALMEASYEAEVILINQNNFESYHLFAPFMRYGSLSIDEAINSENVIIRAFSMLDRRLGKRKLKELNFTENTHPIIVKFYNIRCSVEGIRSK
jgi:hypothetical protein